MGAMLSTYRKSDAVIMICQDNAKRVIEIGAINDVAERILGYKSEEISHKSLFSILPSRLEESIRDMVEFVENGPDLAEVLNKLRNFTIKNKQGQEIPYNFKIVRSDTIDRNPLFQLVLVDEEVQKQKLVFRNVIHENFKGFEVVDQNTGQPNRASLIKDLELKLFHANSKDLVACFAVIEIDRFTEFCRIHGDEAGLQLHRHIAALTKNKLRFDDTIGSLSLHSIGVVLMETNNAAARMVFNRLRWSIVNTPFITPKNESVAFTVSIAFCRIEGNVKATDFLEKCEEYLASQRDKDYTGSTLHEVVVDERRNKAFDRRQKKLAVAIERRKSERRGTTDGDPANG